MNPLGLAARIVVAVALSIALALSFVSSFLVVSFDIEGLEATSAGTSAWHGSGILGCLSVLGGLALAIVAAALPTKLSSARRLLSGLAAAACLLAIGLFVLFLVIETNDLPDGLNGLNLGFGWSGFAVLAVLAVGMLAGLAGALLADRPGAPETPNPPQWA